MTDQPNNLFIPGPNALTYDDFDDAEKIAWLEDRVQELETHVADLENRLTPDSAAGVAREAGAEGVWFIRGARNARLVYDIIPVDPPYLPGVRTDANVSINFNIADAPLLLIARFPNAGGEPGIESR